MAMARSLGGLANCTAEHLGMVTGEGLKWTGGVARYQLDVIGSEVAVTFAESCEILTEGIGYPLR